MASVISHSKRKPKDNQFPLDLGVRGRKTGLTVPDSGIRDENGLEPMDHLFSSPEKPTRFTGKNAEMTLSDEEDMDLVESTIPDPVEALAQRKQASMRMPPPRAKSPIKTFLKSPARRNPSNGSASSPFKGPVTGSRAGSNAASVHRKLDFSRASLEACEESILTNRFTPSKTSKPLGSIHSRGIPQISQSEESEEQQDDSAEDEVGLINGEYWHSVDQNYGFGAPPDDDEDPGPEPEPPLNKINGRGTEGKAKVTEALKASKRAQSKKLDTERITAELQDNPAEEAMPPRKRARKSIELPIATANKSFEPKKGIASDLQQERHVKQSESSLETPLNSQSASGKISTKAVKPKARPKSKLAPIKETDSPQVHRGPPIPRTQGILIHRRETPIDNPNIKKTRSGRNSIKPLAFWTNERVEFTDGEFGVGEFPVDFTGRQIKHIIRAEEIVNYPKRARSKSQAPKSKRIKNKEPDSEEEGDETEPWETDPGRIIGEVRAWDPDDETGSMTMEREEEIALSSAAIITSDVANSSFRFAKMITLPFFGAGMVDLPPGAFKKQKNSRKMQMVFFVFYGRVQVTINDNIFRIGKGGMWQVPRGNFYSIENDYDRPARIFFSQGCEIEQTYMESQPQSVTQ